MDLDGQLKNEIKAFVAFLVPIDGSTDIIDVSQLTTFIRGVDDTLNITEEFVEMVPKLDTTTATDILTALVGTLNSVEVDWSCIVSLATDGAPSMIGKSRYCTKGQRESANCKWRAWFRGLFTVLVARRL